MERDRFTALEAVLLEYVVRFGMIPSARRYYEKFIERAESIEATDGTSLEDKSLRFDA